MSNGYEIIKFTTDDGKVRPALVLDRRDEDREELKDNGDGTTTAETRSAHIADLLVFPSNAGEHNEFRTVELDESSDTATAAPAEPAPAPAPASDGTAPAGVDQAKWDEFQAWQSEQAAKSSDPQPPTEPATPQPLGDQQA